MNKTDAMEPQSARALVNPPARERGRPALPFPDRRRTPRPPLAEIRRGGKLNLLPPVVVSGAVRTAEFLIVAVLGFAIYVGYVEYEGEEAHLIYLGAVLIAATATMAIFQTLGLYQMPAFNAFVRSFTRSCSPGRL